MNRFELDTLKRDWIETVSGDDFLRTVKQHITQIEAASVSAMDQGILIADSDPVQFAAAFFASLHSGAPTILANPKWQQREWEQLAKQVNPAIVFGKAGISTVGTSESNNPRPATILIPTGGSSGRLKLAVHTWETLSVACYGLRSFMGSKPVNSCCMLPLYHVSGLMQLMRSFTSKGQIVFTDFKALQSGQFPKTDAGKLCLSLVPTQLQRFLEQATLIDWLCSLKAIFVGGAPMSVQLQKRLRELHLPVVPTYGMTETAAMITALPTKDFLAGNSSVGYPLEHTDIQVVRPDGLSCLPEERGRIRIQARSLCLGYHGAPFNLSKEEGYLSADEGYLDHNGCLHVVGRSDRIIISGGEKIDPLEVEAAFLDTGTVEQVLAIGWPDPEWGERLITFCVPKSKTEDVDSLRRLLKARLANYKIPKQIIEVPQLPSTPQGKSDHTLIEKFLRNMK